MANVKDIVSDSNVLQNALTPLRLSDTDNIIEPGNSMYLSAFNHYGNVPHHNDEVIDAYEIRCTVWGDYVGCTVERSNYRAILSDYPQFVFEVSGDFYSSMLAIPANLEVTEELEYFLECLGNLTDYPLWSEEDHSFLEEELFEEDLDDYIIGDIVSQLDSHFNIDDADEEKIREIIYNYHSNGDGSNGHSDSAVAWYFPNETMRNIVADYMRSLIADYLAR